MALAIATFEIYGWKFSGYLTLIGSLISACANKIFQKWTVFVFNESWSHDQVMQRAYCSIYFVLTDLWENIDPH